MTHCSRLGCSGLVFCEGPAAAQRQEGWAGSLYLQLRKLVLALSQVLKQTKPTVVQRKDRYSDDKKCWGEKGTVAVRHQEELEVKRVSWMTGKEGELGTFSGTECGRCSLP